MIFFFPFSKADCEKEKKITERGCLNLLHHITLHKYRKNILSTREE
jgi:hypothetical protein